MIADYSNLSREELIAAIAELEKAISELSGQLQLKDFTIAGLLKKIYGTKSEKLDALVDQLRLFQEATARQTEKKETERQTISYTRDKPSQKHPGRQDLPEHLRREEVVLMPDEDITGCKQIGEEITEQLVIPHPEPFVRRYVRPKFITPESLDGSQHVIIAPLPKMLIDKCIASPETLASIVVDKHVFHLPVFRQRQRLGGFGINIAASTADNWQRELGMGLRPLLQVHRSEVLITDYLQVDETRIDVQDRQKKGKTHRGTMWVYTDTVSRCCLFDYQRGKGAEHCSEILGGFSGYLQTDGNQVYDTYKKGNARSDIVGVACWAHARRKFHDALEYDQTRVRPILKLIQELYHVEADAREHGLTYDQRHALRLERSKTLLEAIRAALDTLVSAGLVPGTPIEKATTYTLKLWSQLTSYLKDGRLEIDNNPVENTIRPLALGRKNFLFAGSHEGAVNIAMYRSFFSTCKMQGVDPYAWMLHVIRTIPETPADQYHTLLPQNIDRALLPANDRPYQPTT